MPSHHPCSQNDNAATLLPAPDVNEARGNILDPTEVPEPGCTLVAPFLQTQPGDRVQFRWYGSGRGGVTSAFVDLDEESCGNVVQITIPKRYITNNFSRRVVVDYYITRQNMLLGTSSRLILRVGNVHLDLDPPSIDEARDRVLDQLDLADVSSLGVMVRLPATYALRVGDIGKVRWVGASGAGTFSVPFKVYPGEEGRDKLIPVPWNVVVASDGGEIELECTVVRHNGNQQTSRKAGFDLRLSLGSGRLLVMGARSRGGYQEISGGCFFLAAFDTTTREPFMAQWRYNGETAVVTGTNFRDIQPDRLLHVWVDGDWATINPRNLAGNGNLISDSNLDHAAFCARLNRGSLVAWGHAGRGADLGPTLPALTDIVSVCPSGYAFAARRADGRVVAWGRTADGGVVPAPIAELTDIVTVTGNGYAFVAIRRDGSLVAWGGGRHGADLPAPIAALKDVVAVIGNLSSFAALRSNGSVVAWGDPAAGGTVPDPIAALTDIRELTGNHMAFTALRMDGSVVAWGRTDSIGEVPESIALLKDIEEVSSTLQAFTVRRTNGSAMAWGNPSYGAFLPGEIADLTDIRSVTGNRAAFVAMRANGSVVAWGANAGGGNLPDPVTALTNIVQVAAAANAFAALCADGSVVAWGHPGFGGEIPELIAAQLTNVHAIYANTHAFAALTRDGRVVTWGRERAGGNSEIVADELNGKISYEDLPVSSRLA